MGVRLVVAPEVLDALGGARAARTQLGRVKAATFTCVACAAPGRLSEEPAAVVVVVVLLDVGGGTMPFVKFAHATCSGSRVAHGGSLAPGVVPRMHAIGWVDTAGPQRRAVLLVGPVATPTATTSSGDATDLLVASLHRDGFTPVGDVVSTPPALPGLVARHGADGLVVWMPGGEYTLYDGPPVGGEAWARVAASQRRVTVLAASGMRLDNPGRDHMADLFTAIGRGLVVGAVAAYTAQRPRTPGGQPPRSGRRKRRGTRPR